MTTHPDAYTRRKADGTADGIMLPIAQGVFVSDYALRDIGHAPLAATRPGTFCAKEYRA
jgi:hypothetical protein